MSRLWKTTGLLISRGHKDDVPIQRSTTLFQGEESFEMHDAQGLHVEHAATVQHSINLHRFQWVSVPSLTSSVTRKRHRPINGADNLFPLKSALQIRVFRDIEKFKTHIGGEGKQQVVTVERSQ